MLCTEIIFTKGNTESITVANGFSKLLHKGDEIIVSVRTSFNIVPWQMACEFSGAELKVIPIQIKES